MRLISVSTVSGCLSAADEGVQHHDVIGSRQNLAEFREEITQGQIQKTSMSMFQLASFNYGKLRIIHNKVDRPKIRVTR